MATTTKIPTIPASDALAEARAKWDTPWLDSPDLDRTALTAHVAGLILASKVRTQIGDLVMVAGSWTREDGDRADALHAPGTPEWEAELGPHSEVTLTADGGYAARHAWCVCHQDDASWVAYEGWTAAGREAHGFVCAECRQLLQVG